MNLIDKDTLVAEIERRKKEAESNCGGYKSYDEHRCDSCIVGFYEEFLEIINTLEVKDENTIKRDWYNQGYIKGRKEANIPAKELGLPSELNTLEIKERDLSNFFDATVCKIGNTYLKEMDRDAIIKVLEPYKDGDKVKVIIKRRRDNKL